MWRGSIIIDWEKILNAYLPHKFLTLFRNNPGFFENFFDIVYKELEKMCMFWDGNTGFEGEGKGKGGKGCGRF